MLYSIIRFIISVILFLTLLFIVIKLKPKKIKLFIIIDIILSSIIMCFLYLFPIENNFINFYSPEDVFVYTSTGKISDIIYGDNSCMIVYSDDSGYHMSFVKEDNESYKIVTFIQCNSEMFLSKDIAFLKITTFKDIKDCYCFGAVQNITNNVNVTDNVNSNYHILQGDNNLYYFYGHISDYNKDYTLYVNNKETKLINTSSQ